MLVMSPELFEQTFVKFVTTGPVAFEMSDIVML